VGLIRVHDQVVGGADEEGGAQEGEEENERQTPAGDLRKKVQKIVEWSGILERDGHD
jgi:hypothetical protein